MKVRNTKRGFTLVELMIVVAIIGVLAALAIYGVRRYLTNSKTAEARENIGALSRDAAAAFPRPKMAQGLMALGETRNYSNYLCESALAPVPAALNQVANGKYQSAPAEWAQGTETVGWKCLGFTIDVPQIYQYNYTAVAPYDAIGGQIAVEAFGDLDGDGTPSQFRREGLIEQDTGGMIVKMSGSIEETDPEE